MIFRKFTGSSEKMSKERGSCIKSESDKREEKSKEKENVCYNSEGHGKKQ